MTTNVLSFLEDSARRYPAKIAVEQGERSLCFAQWMLYSRQIGSALALRVPRNAPVGVFMEKGMDALCTFFGAAYAGACYAMLNAELPDARLKQIQSVLQTRCIVTTADLRQRAEVLFPDVTVLCVEAVYGTPIDELRLRKIREHMIDTDPLYINFTSGSTGTPKGIAVSHRSVIDFMECFPKLFSISGADVIANQAPFDFDVSVKDIYTCVKTGATLVILPRTLFSTPARLLDALCAHRVTTLIWAVSALCLISSFHALDYKTPSTVTKVLFSGEVMPHKHFAEWKKHLPNAMYVNLYGPTEITCNCTYHILEKGRDYSAGIPIGKPFPNEDVFLLDEQGEQITAPGVPGVIAVRGTALALGYYRLPEKTDAHFVQNPLQSAYPERIYLTGDLGRYDEAGDLFYCGRLDNQIKYMGHRIELEEVEHAVSAIPGVERCCCVFKKEKAQLHLHYTGIAAPEELHQKLREVLPVYMVPSYLHQADALPLSKNGKIDRKMLLEATR